MDEDKFPVCIRPIDKRKLSRYQNGWSDSVCAKAYHRCLGALESEEKFRTICCENLDCEY